MAEKPLVIGLREQGQSQPTANSGKNRETQKIRVSPKSRDSQEKERDKQSPVSAVKDGTLQTTAGAQDQQTEKVDAVVNSQAKTHLERLDDLGIVLNPSLVRLVKTTAAEIIEGAIAAYRQYRRDHYVKNPAGFFVYAVKNAVANNHTSEKANFFYWFEAMKKLGRLGYYEEVDGDYLVRDGQHLVSWQVLVKRGWTCEYLQKRLRR